jgi:hypothetical protein
MLRRNPAAYDLWEGRKINSDTDPAADAFLNASTFPDAVRPPSTFSREYHRSTHHYVTYRYVPGDPDAGKVEAPPDEENLLTTYRANLATVKSTDRRVSAREKAIALSWIFHQVGDIHQPLHAISRYTARLPDGDRGGNLVKPFPNPRGWMPYSKNLHAYWDDLLGDDKVVLTSADLKEKVEVLLSEYPRARFNDEELKQNAVEVWARESFEAAKQTVYRDLDPEVVSYDTLPVVYEAEAQTLGRRRLALAGYRLAEVLNGLFNDEDD